jgi:uncharacterized protein YndB with AHSA1/START domain
MPSLLIAVYIFAAILLVIAGLAMIARVVGARIPLEHRASASVRLNSPPQAVWATISDIAGHTQWAGVRKLERLSDHNGHEVWRQFMGHNAFVLETTESLPPQRLVRTIADESKLFSGSWTYELIPDGAGTRVHLAEVGRVDSAIPRFMMKHLFGYHFYLMKHLKALARRVGDINAVVQNG